MKLLKHFTTCLLLTCSLTACDNSNPSTPNTGGSAPNTGGIVDHMASSFVGGMAGGVGAGVGHAVTGHLIKKWQARSRLRRMRSR